MRAVLVERFGGPEVLRLAWVEEPHLPPLEQAGRAHRLGERGRTRGKVVLAVAR